MRQKKTNNIKKLMILLVLTFFVLNIMTSAFNIAKQDCIEYEYYHNVLENQKRFVQDIRKLPSESTIGYWGWWKAPEISYFVENDFVDLSGLNSYGHFKRSNVSSDFVVVTPYQISSDKSSIEMLSPLFGDKIFEECDVYKDCYYLYKYNRSSTMRYNFSSQYP